MTAKITALISKQDTLESVRDKIATILLEESLEQQILAQAITIAYSRADDSDYTVTGRATETKTLEASYLQIGDYVVTAGTLVAGVGTWTCVAPDATEDTCTTEAADDDLEFTSHGLKLTVTAGDEPWDTGDEITATVAAHDALSSRLRIFMHRKLPFAEWLSDPPKTALDAVPIIMIQFDRDSVELAKSDSWSRQQYDAKFSLYCCGYGISTQTETGHTPSDLMASEAAFVAATLVRNILMDPDYDHLDLPDLVGDRMVESRAFGWPDTGQGGPDVGIVTLNLGVDLAETVRTITGDASEGFLVTVKNADTGETYLAINKTFDA